MAETFRSLLDGMARLWDFSGFYTSVLPGEGTRPTTDAEAIHRDWAMVGKDLRTALDAQAPVASGTR